MPYQWRRISRSTLVQVMACCLTSPSQYLNHHQDCSVAFAWEQFQKSFINLILNTCSEITRLKLLPPRGQWVKGYTCCASLSLSASLSCASSLFSVEVSVARANLKWLAAFCGWPCWKNTAPRPSKDCHCACVSPKVGPCNQYRDVIWELRCFKTSDARVFVQNFIQAAHHRVFEQQRNIKAPHYWPFVRGIHRSTSQRACNAESVSMPWRHHVPGTKYKGTLRKRDLAKDGREVS